MEGEQLKLSNQLCFPVYAASRLITREYQPYLDKLGITYPQYLVLLVLWETDSITVNDIAAKLILNTNTITPLLKRMETMGLITRTRSGSDERKVVIALTPSGQTMRQEALTVPLDLANRLKSSSLTMEELIVLKDTLNELIDFLGKKEGM
jgi:DNA-binding MarR family transcriptional regulator